MISIEKAVQNIEAKYGKGSVINFEDTVDSNVEMISSGSLELDLALGGGYAKGRVVEVFGEESSGKSTLAIHACIEAQKEGKIAVYIDNEHAFDRDYAKSLGVNFDKNLWLFSQPSTGEETFDIIEEFLQVQEIGIIIVDSVAAMVPRSELEGDFGDSKMGLHARLMSQGFRKLINKISKTGVIVYFINQQRDKIGVMFGDSKTTTGGNALKFYATQRIKVARIGTNKNSNDEMISISVRAEVKKNKVAPPFRKADFIIEFGKGLDYLSELINLGVKFGFIKKSGSWFSYEQVKLGQGIENVKSLLTDNPELMDELETLVKSKLKRK